MIPQSALSDLTVETELEPSLTWQLDFEKGRIGRKIDGLAAVKQAIFKILQTSRYQFLIYSFNYGHELNQLIGLPPLFVQSELTRCLEEALLQDQRITAIEDIEVELVKDLVHVSFTAVTIFGNLAYQQEVELDV